MDYLGLQIIRGGLNLGQGVSFFFVLSGFILTYVYSDLKGWYNIKLFYKARFAGIWPVYIVSFIFGYLLLNYKINMDTLISFLLMIQSWFPISTYYFSYNAVVWSISTEFFFYLLFPLLISSWDTTKLKKTSLSLITLVILMLVSNYFELLSYSKPEDHSINLGITTHGLLYISPLSRIFEFIFGMLIAHIYINNINSKNTELMSTIYEVITIILIVISMMYMKFFINFTNNSFLSPALGHWLVHSGSMFAFGLLIYVIAKGNGKISNILKKPFFVILGEISFSIYLFHQILLIYYRQNISIFSYYSNEITFIIYLVVLICISYLAWYFIEIPFRKRL